MYLHTYIYTERETEKRNKITTMCSTQTKHCWNLASKLVDALSAYM